MFQDLALAPLRRCGATSSSGRADARRDPERSAFMKKTAKEEMSKMGIDLPRVDQPVGLFQGVRTPIGGHRPRRVLRARV